MGKTILVLGAGTGGIITAKELSKKPGREKREVGDFSIILFEKEEKNVFAPSLLWLMVGKRKPKQVYQPGKNFCPRTGTGIQRGLYGNFSWGRTNSRT